MESTEAGSIEDSLDSKNLETSMGDIVVAKYEDCNSEVLSSQNDEDQSGEQVYGYLEVRNPGSEDATIILDSEVFNLNCQRMILTQNDDGNGIIVVVSEDPDGQPLEQTFAHASVLHSDEVNFGDGLKEHSTLVMDEQSQGLEFIETEEVPQEHGGRHVYIENSGGIINISNENQCSPINSVNIESPLWSVSNNPQLKNDSTEMLFIPNPTVVFAPEETRHRKLMQLACIAHELQSADQKISATAVNESARDVEPSLGEFETSVIVTQSEVEKDPNKTLIETSSEGKDPENAECLPSNDSKTDDLEFSPRTVFKSVDVSSLLSCASARPLDNAVSVIHTTSSELQDIALENQAKDNTAPDFSSVKNYHNSESELPSEMLYSSRISRMSLHGSLDEEPSNSKQLEECSREDLEENNQLTIADDNNESKGDAGREFQTDIRVRELELNCSPGPDDSPINFNEKLQKQVSSETLDIQDNSLRETEPDIRVDDHDSQDNSCVEVVKDDEPKECNEDSNLSVTARDSFPPAESHLLDINQRTCLRENEVPTDVDSELSTSDNDAVDNDEHDASTSANDSPFFNTKYLNNYKQETEKPFLTKNIVLSPELQDYETSETNCQHDLNELDMDNDSSKVENNSKCEPMDFEDSPTDNLDSDLVIAENAEDEEINNSTNEYRSVKNASQNLTFEETLESNSTKNTEQLEYEKTLSAEINSENSKSDVELEMSLDNKSVIEENVNESNSVEAVSTNLDSNTADDDFSYNEETLVKTPIKTYIRKKAEKSTIENKSSVKENIELFSVDDFNFSECDKDISDVENSLNLDQNKESASISHESNAESDDHLLLSDVQSKVSTTYNRKKKYIPTAKQRLRTRSLRPRSLPVKLPLENGTQEISDNESKKKRSDSSSFENIPWGDVLMSTSFQPRNESNTANDKPSTSFAIQSPIESSTPRLSPEQRKRKLNKSTRDFDRLLHSSPVRSKKHKINTKRQIPRGRKKILKSRQSKVLPSTSYSEFLGTYDCTPVYNVGASTSTIGHKSSREVKKATIQYLNQNIAKYQEERLKQDEEIFSCSSCTFVSKRVNNLIEHLKYCKSMQPVLTYSVNDMDKRQRIRGDDSIEKGVTGGCNGAIRSNDRKIPSQGEYSGGYKNQDPEEGIDLDFLSDNKKKTQYGYGEDDIVWVKYKDRFWPALVCEIKGSRAYVMLIKHPETDKGLKVKHENVRTFDDAKWNCLCLQEAVNLPYNSIFVTSVQSAETFMRRKFLGFNVVGRTFFSVQDGDFCTDTASSESIGDVSDDDDDDDDDDQVGITIRFPPPSRKYRYDKLDKERILCFILEGSVDEYVLDIYFEKVYSHKHVDFFNNDRKSNLLHRPWFGPFEDKSEKEDLFFHFRNVFCAKVRATVTDPKFSMTSYVTQVWIPEAIVKAISVVNDISLEAAGTLFESEDSLDLDNDPLPGTICKMYS